MGKPMAKNLLKAGYQLVVYSRRRASVDELLAAGAQPARSSREVAERSEAVITMLPNSPEVREVILGKEGVLEGAKPGSVIIDMSSIAPLVSMEIAKVAAAKGVYMLDAPVSGGEPGAIQRTLSIMVGGNQEQFDACYDLLKAMGSSVVRVGEIGSGNVAKLANQVIVALNIAAMSEALVLGTKAGLDPNVMYEAIKGGLAGSHVLDAKVPLVVNRKFDPGFRINLHIKDLANVLETSHQLGIPLPLTASVLEMMQALKVDGHGDEDHSALVKFYEKLSQVVVQPLAKA
ncbi:MAG: 2-hydroxy-3-oxopropionate reductase [Firmicutes bacterium]|nr:2-hydroxy-3-oxopropionate reductase [Bacillota bacterium]